MNLKFFQPKPVALKVHLMTRKPETLRLHELRADERLTSNSAAILSNEHLKIMVDVLRNEHPAYNVLPPDTMEHVRAAQQARCEGYTLCLSNLLSMGTHQPVLPELLADFGAEEIELPVKRK